MRIQSIRLIAYSIVITVSIAVAAPRGTMGQAVQIAIAGVDCGDGRVIVAHVLNEKFVMLNNHETVDFRRLESRLHEIYERVAERVLFIEADPGIEFQSVAYVIDIAKKQVEVVALLTPSVEKHPCWRVRKPAPIEWISTGRQPLTQ